MTCSTHTGIYFGLLERSGFYWLLWFTVCPTVCRDGWLVSKVIEACQHQRVLMTNRPQTKVELLVNREEVTATGSYTAMRGSGLLLNEGKEINEKC